MMIHQALRRWFAPLAGLLLCGALAACGGGGAAPPSKITTSHDGATKSRSMGAYKIGAPYQIDGTWYYPREDYAYDERGVASWYGPGFDGKSTANGEIYDQNDLTAAHRTLPLPSLVRVTNLENGKSLVLRVNDRGPFAKSRIIDVSKRAATLLGFHEAGTTHIEVQVLPEESRALKADILTASGDMPKINAAPSAGISSQPLAPVVGMTVPPMPTQVVTTSKTNDTLSNPQWVNAGSFRDRSQANELQQRLQALAPVVISESSIGGAPVYRVRLGPVTTQRQAAKLLAAVRAQGLSDARLVIE